jgi:DNA-binding response OmpR family regulator
MDQILLYEPDQTRSRRFTFLLGMAGHKCSVTYTLDETLSWLHSEKLLSSHLRLLLLGSYPLDSELLTICAELKSLWDIPILCLAKPPDVPDDRVIFCAPEKLIGCINAILTATEAENSQRSG